MKNIIFFDVEATGLNVATDRIVQLMAYEYMWAPEGLVGVNAINMMFNPGMEMSEEVIKIHGITNEEAKKHKPFGESAKKLFTFFQGKDLGGFNLLNFDIPILWEEFYRAKFNWEITGLNIIDVGNIFKKKEERTLSAAVKFYLNKEHDAHDAGGDTVATAEVLDAMLDRYDDLGNMDLASLAKFSQFDDRVDIAGKIVRNKDGVPVYSFGKSKDVPVTKDPGFGFWMLDKDFPTQTKQVLRMLLQVED